jgi:hypothetical protein
MNRIRSTGQEVKDNTREPLYNLDWCDETVQD